MPSNSRPPRRSFGTRVAVTLAACAAASLATVVLREQIQQTILIFFWGALFAAAFYAGFGAALFVIAFAVLAVNPLLLGSRGTFRLADPGTLISIAVFVLLGLFTSWLAGRVQAAESAAHERANLLEDQTIELESQMEENQALTQELEASLADAQDARVAAEAANRAKSDFLAVMSHELRTPLNAIVGYTDLLQTEVAGPLTDKQRKQLGRVHASAWHLLELIQDVLSFARIEAGRETIRLSDVESGKLAQDVVAFIEPDVSAKGLRLRTQLPSEPLIILTDPGKLRQILLNLLANAVKFTERGEIGLSLKRVDSAIEFRVWDTGDGIDEADHDRVFEPFTQVDQSTTREKGGVGLGLPVSRALAGMLGGTLTLSSGRGRGTNFSLRLPMQPLPEPS